MFLGFILYLDKGNEVFTMSLLRDFQHVLAANYVQAICSHFVRYPR
jgi:hypothetical protein